MMFFSSSSMEEIPGKIEVPTEVEVGREKRDRDKRRERKKEGKREGGPLYLMLKSLWEDYMTNANQIPVMILISMGDIMV